MYNVVFEYKEGCNKGCRTWTTFDSKKHFDDFWKDFEFKNNEFIVEEDVSVERARELIDEVPKEHVALAMMRSGVEDVVEAIKTIVDRIKEEQSTKVSNG